MGHIIDKLSNSKYSRPTLAGGLVIMLFFGAMPINQNAFATNTEEQFLETADGELYPFGQFFFIPAHPPFCEIPHWHSDGGVATSTKGVELPETMGECGYGATLPGAVVTLTTCDNPGEICRPGAGVCDRFEECTADGFCPADLFLQPGDVTSPCAVDQNECTTDPVCDGSGPSCPSEFVANVGSSCGPGTSCTTDMCDANAVCQTGTPKAEGEMCGDDTNNLCNFADTCDGAGTCQNNFADIDSFCIGTVGIPGPFSCDATAQCDGLGSCVDQFQSAGTECGLDIPTTCNTKNTCDSAGNCVDNFEDKGFLCGFTLDACDENDECDGAGNCEDLKTPKGTSCGDPAGTTCTDPDTCDGSGVCDENNAPFLTACDIDPCKDEACGAGTCNPVGNEPDGKVCGPALDTCHDPKECQAGACAPSAPISCTDGDVCTTDFCVLILGCQNIPITTGPICGPTNPCLALNCNDGNACTADSCDPASGCVNTAIMCDDSNQCTADSCNPASGCKFTPTTAMCNDMDSCTSNDKCVLTGECVGDSVPACLIIDSGDTPTDDFTLSYKCEDENTVTLTDVTYTEDGNVLSPSGMSFSCPDDVTVPLPITGTPNDFSAHVNINGIDGDCNLECVEPDDCEDLTAISFDLNDNDEVVCFKGEGSAAILILSPPTSVAVGGTFIPIDSTALLVAYAQNNLAWIIPLLMITAAIGFMKFGRSKSSENSI